MIGTIYSWCQKQDNKQREAFPAPYQPLPSVSVHLCCCSSGFADQEIKKALFALPGNVLNGLVTTGQPKRPNWWFIRVANRCRKWDLPSLLAHRTNGGRLNICKGAMFTGPVTWVINISTRSTWPRCWALASTTSCPTATTSQALRACCSAACTMGIHIW